MWKGWIDNYEYNKLGMENHEASLGAADDDYPAYEGTDGGEFLEEEYCYYTAEAYGG